MTCNAGFDKQRFDRFIILEGLDHVERLIQKRKYEGRKD